MAIRKAGRSTSGEPRRATRRASAEEAGGSGQGPPAISWAPRGSLAQAGARCRLETAEEVRNVRSRTEICGPRAGDPPRRFGAAGAVLILGGTTALEFARGAEAGLQIFPTGFPDPSEMQRFVALVVFFALLVPVLDRIVFRPLLAVLAAREESSASARRRAAELNREAERLLGRRETALREARATAQEQRALELELARDRSREEIASAQSGAEARGREARAAIARSLDAARRDIAGEAEALAQIVASRLVGRDLG